MHRTLALTHVIAVLVDLGMAWSRTRVNTPSIDRLPIRCRHPSRRHPAFDCMPLQDVSFHHCSGHTTASRAANIYSTASPPRVLRDHAAVSDPGVRTIPANPARLHIRSLGSHPGDDLTGHQGHRPGLTCERRSRDGQRQDSDLGV